MADTTAADVLIFHVFALDPGRRLDTVEALVRVGGGQEWTVIYGPERRTRHGKPMGVALPAARSRITALDFDLIVADPLNSTWATIPLRDVLTIEARKG